MKRCVLFIFLISLFTMLLANDSMARQDLNLYLGAPYITNPLGEGENDRYAPRPLFRNDGFDCTTYVEAILAQHNQDMALDNFHDKIRLLRYVDGKVDFFSRAHIMEAHWIPNAVKYNFIRPYPIEQVELSQFRLNLQSWFLENESVKNKDDKYIEIARKQPMLTRVATPYVPRERITSDFLEILPDMMVVFFIKELPKNTWSGQDTDQKLITHMGILKDRELYHASLTTRKVTRLGLLEYLAAHKNFIGVSFYEVN